MTTALLIIATGALYWNFAHNLIISADEYFFPHDVILFTDSPSIFNMSTETRFIFKPNLKYIKIPPAGYPEATLKRYHTFLDQKYLLSQYDSLWYADADMRFVASVKEEDIMSSGITSVLHPGYAVPRNFPIDFVGTVGTPERRPESACYIPISANNKYFCGGFNGGKTESYLKMAEAIKDMVDRDAEKGIVPLWHDESCLNRYLYDNPPARILTPSFCHPEGYNTHNGGYGWAPETYPPVLLALNKPGHFAAPTPIPPPMPSTQFVKRGSERVPGSKSRSRPRMFRKDF